MCVYVFVCLCVCLCVCSCAHSTYSIQTQPWPLAGALYSKPPISSYNYVYMCVYYIYYGMLKYTPIHSSPPPAVPPLDHTVSLSPGIHPLMTGGLQQLASSTEVSTPFLQYIQFLLYRRNFLYFAFCCEPFMGPVGTALCCTLRGPR